MVILQKKYTWHNLLVFEINQNLFMFTALEKQFMVLNKHHVLGTLPSNKPYWNLVFLILSLILHYLCMLLSQLLHIFW
jgi:hypothetical protein